MNVREYEKQQALKKLDQLAKQFEPPADATPDKPVQLRINLDEVSNTILAIREYVQGIQIKPKRYTSKLLGIPIIEIVEE